LEAISSFGTWLKLQRKASDMTQAELARRLGCATVTLQKIELDERRPSKQLAERMAIVLNIPTAQHPAFVRAARGQLATDWFIAEADPDEMPIMAWTPSPRRRHNLPAQSTSFIGRKREVGQARALLCQVDVRLLMLTGPGGTGKTRVSLQLAAELLDTFADGVWFVNLAAIRDPTLVPAAIAAVLGIRDIPDRPLVERLCMFLAAKQLLLLLDNFEQVFAAGPLLADLLAAAPHLKLLVTSRSVLGVYGEQIFVVPPLALHEPTPGMTQEQAAQSEAVALFLARACAANPDFALTPTNAPVVAELCQRLDGLPLAIELAAARTRLLPPQTLLQRLDSRLQLLTGGPRTLPTRQQTLRATLDWSYDLLMPAEQILFRRLAVFEGGWTLEAAEQICATDTLCPLDIVDGLASLTDKSLLRVGTTPDGAPSFSMLETIHEYALERLIAHNEASALRERHARYFLQWLESMQVQYWSGAGYHLPSGRGGPQQDRVIDRVRAELRNLAATVTWIIDHGTWDLGLSWEDATQPPFGYVERLGWVSRVWKRWHQELMDSRESVPERVWAEGLVRIGRLAYWDDDLQSATTILQEGLALARNLDDPALIALALEWLAHANRDQDMYVRAVPLYEEVMAHAQASGEPYDIASAHHCLGELALLQEDYQRALAQTQASLPVFRALGVEWGITCVSINQGFAASHLGNDILAAQCFSEALQVALRYDGGSHIRGALAGFVALAARGGAHQAERAARLLGAITEGSMVHAHRRACEQIVAAARPNHDAALWEAAYAEGHRMTLEQAAAYALGAVK
jgi:predicted ATPase/transcriptional regulator with XRE-family HTH domain